LSTLLLNIRPQETRQFTSSRHFDQLEALAVAITVGVRVPLPHLSERRSRESKGIPTSPNPDRSTPLDDGIVVSC